MTDETNQLRVEVQYRIWLEVAGAILASSRSRQLSQATRQLATPVELRTREQVGVPVWQVANKYVGSAWFQ